MNALAFGLLASLPIAAWLTFRSVQLRQRMDVRARLALWIKGGAFLAASALITGSLYAFRGAMPLPMIWVLLLEIAGVSLMIGVIRRSG